MTSARIHSATASLGPPRCGEGLSRLNTEFCNLIQGAPSDQGCRLLALFDPTGHEQNRYSISLSSSRTRSAPCPRRDPSISNLTLPRYVPPRRVRATCGPADAPVGRRCPVSSCLAGYSTRRNIRLIAIIDQSTHTMRPPPFDRDGLCDVFHTLGGGMGAKIKRFFPKMGSKREKPL
jgi:hypothetical protein